MTTQQAPTTLLNPDLERAAMYLYGVWFSAYWNGSQGDFIVADQWRQASEMQRRAWRAVAAAVRRAGRATA